MKMSQIANKKFVRSVDSCVEDNLMGFVKLHKGLKLVKGYNIVVREDLEWIKNDNHVTVLSGGGAGHEPFAAGFVGRGMLTGAVCGAIFTSPSSSHVLAAVQLLATGNSNGTLILVANYTGDRLTFGQALERARLDGHSVQMIVVGEDCALTSINKSVGRRGLSGMIFMQKLAGAMSEDGHTLDEIVQTVTAASKNMGTIGVCQNSCSLPGSGPLFPIGPDEIELGLGIHGEAGVKRVKIRSSDVVVEMMIKHMTNPDSASRLEVKKGDRVAVLINNLGSLTNLEMNIVALDVVTYLVQVMEVSVERCYVGTVETSLEMSGFSISVLHVNAMLLKLLDAPTCAPAWCQLGSGLLNSNLLMEPLKTEETNRATRNLTATLKPHEAELVRKSILQACEALELNETKLNALDSGCGDGDCGTTLKKGAKAIESILNTEIDCSCPMEVFLRIGSAVSESMGGCSGGLLSIFFTSASGALANALNPIDWCDAMETGTRSIMQYGGAAPGDRTMLEPLHAAHQMLRAQLEVGSRPLASLTESVAAAREACKQTAGMKARAGRASYVGPDFLAQQDAGATAVVLILEAILETIKAG